MNHHHQDTKRKKDNQSWSINSKSIQAERLLDEVGPSGKRPRFVPYWASCRVPCATRLKREAGNWTMHMQVAHDSLDLPIGHAVFVAVWLVDQSRWLLSCFAMRHSRPARKGFDTVRRSGFGGYNWFEKTFFSLFQLGIWFTAMSERIVGALDGQHDPLRIVIPGWMKFDREKCDGRW